MSIVGLRPDLGTYLAYARFRNVRIFTLVEDISLPHLASPYPAFLFPVYLQRSRPRPLRLSIRAYPETLHIVHPRRCPAALSVYSRRSLDYTPYLLCRLAGLGQGRIEDS